MVIFTEHAIVKLVERGIKKNLVVEALERSDYSVLSYGDRRISYKKFKKLYLSVVYKIESGNMVVITAHWVEKIKKK